MREEKLQMAYLENTVDDVVKLAENKKFNTSRTVLLDVMKEKIFNKSISDFYDILRTPEYEAVEKLYFDLKDDVATGGDNVTKEVTTGVLKNVFPRAADNWAVDKVVMDTFSEATSQYNVGHFNSVSFSSYSNIVRVMREVKPGDAQVYDVLHDFQVSNKNWSDPTVVLDKLREVRDLYVEKKKPVLLEN